jgi:methylornithine synthase
MADHPLLTDILFRATRGTPLTHSNVVYLLSLRDNASIEMVKKAARAVREQHFGEKIFLYGFIYLSTYCRNHCSFCFYRKTNRLSPRYRKSSREVEEIALRLAGSGVHLVDLTLGEDPFIHDTENYDPLYEMIRSVKAEAGVPVMISPGVVSDRALLQFAALGVDWYALYQETHNPVLFRKLRNGQSFRERERKRSFARRAGMLVEDGILLGLGETVSDRADSIAAMKRAGAHQARVMSFVPQSETPLAGEPSPPRNLECLCIAVMRLTMPQSLIPASLDVDGIEGLGMRLEAGANVVTSIIPPSRRLAGVSQSSLGIERGLRTVPEVMKILGRMDMRVASREGYASWMADRRAEAAQGEGWEIEDRNRGGTTAGLGGRVSEPGSRLPDDACR